MIRLAAVALIVAAMLVIRQVGPPTPDDAARGTALALGFTMIAALVAGEFLRRFRLPRLTGYLLFGLLVGPYLGNVITEGMDLNSLIGTEFEIQGVRFLGMAECSPCEWQDQAFHPGTEEALQGRGGLRAKILSDGVLRAE